MSENIDWSKGSLEKVIVGVRLEGVMQDIGAAVSKAMPSHSRYRYFQQLVYQTDDGTEVVAHATGITKPRLATHIESIRNNVAKRCVSAVFYHPIEGDGLIYYGTTTKYAITAHGMQAIAAGSGS